MRRAINHARVFAGFRKVFGVHSYSMVASLAGFDSGYVSKMRSGKRPLSHQFFLACCIAADLSPVDMCKRVGINHEYFMPQ